MVTKAVHFGGGNIGRGFVAEKLAITGYEVVFVDVVDALIEKLKSTPSYTVIEVGTSGTKENTISNYRAINSKYNEADVIKEISEADIVTCAVGVNILKFIAPVIAKAIDARTLEKPLAVIACENAIGGTDRLREHITDPKNMSAENKETISKRARFANSAIDRIVPGQDPNAGLNVTIESYFEWVVEKTPFGDSHPEIKGVTWVDDLTPFIERKLYTVNTSHAAAAYYGHARKMGTIDKAMANKEIHDIVRDAVKETANLIVKKHGIGEKEQQEYVEKIITRISNPHLKDVVERVGRAPIRKLGPTERFVGPAKALAEMGESVDALVGCIEMAFRFTDVEEDEEAVELKKILSENDAAAVVEKVCQLKESDKLYPRVLEVVKKVQGGS